MLYNIYSYILCTKQIVVMFFVIITTITYVKGPISFKTIKHEAASSAIKAVHCTPPGGAVLSTWNTRSCVL